MDSYPEDFYRIDGVISPIMKIAYSLPNRMPAGARSRGNFTHQGYIIKGLEKQNKVDIIVQCDTWDMGIDDNNGQVVAFDRTWSKSLWFKIATNLTWRIQKLFRIPNLNCFTTLARFDALRKPLSSYDLVIERLGKYRASVALTAKSLKKPYILFFIADPIFEEEFRGHPVKGLLKWQARNMILFCLRTADKVVCVSSALQRQLENNYGIPADKITVLPNCVDIHKFRSYPEKRAAIRQKYNIGDNPLIVFVGTFYEWQDIATLVEAFGALHDKIPQARLVLVGDGVTKTKIEDLVLRLGLDKAVSLTGSIPFDEVPYLLSAADVTVAPYKKMKMEFWESPMKLFEYMASGTPLITSSIGQISEIIKNDENGLLVEPGDVCALSLAMEKLINNPTLRSSLSQNARLDVERSFSWEQYVGRLENLVNEVLASHDGKIDHKSK
jgi:glycosyltransferase involved in cell wall biosynthesis